MVTKKKELIGALQALASLVLEHRIEDYDKLIAFFNMLKEMETLEELNELSFLGDKLEELMLKAGYENILEAHYIKEILMGMGRMQQIIENYIAENYNQVVKTEIQDQHEQKKKILVVDDSMVIARLLTSKLSSMGYEVDYAKDGTDAVQKLAAFKPDLVLLDLVLPKISGLEILQKIRANDIIKNIKVIIVSSRSKEKDIVLALKLGANDFVPKPFSIEILEEKIKRILKIT